MSRPKRSTPGFPRALAATGALWLATPHPAQAEPEKMHPDDIVRAGCVVHMKEPDAAGIAEVTAECHWPVPPERVKAIVLDQDRIDEVLSTVSESRVLPDGRVVQVHTMGFGVDDRQVTMRNRSEERPDGGLRIDFAKAPRQALLGDGRVQILVSEGYWEIAPGDAGDTRLRYGVRYDPGGNLKPWLVRRFQKNGIAQSMEEVRRAAERAP